MVSGKIKSCDSIATSYPIKMSLETTILQSTPVLSTFVTVCRLFVCYVQTEETYIAKNTQTGQMQNII